MRSIFEDFMELGFGSPVYKFNTNGLYDTMPSFWKKTDEGYKVTLKTLGVSEVLVEIVDNNIKVYGENEIDGLKYDTTINLPVSQDVINNITEVRHKTVCGVTVLNLILDRPEKKNIKITKI